MNKDIVLNTIKADIANGTSNSISTIRQICPQLSDSQCLELIEVIEESMAINSNNTEKVSLVVTAPPSFAINSRTTMSVVRSMILDSEKSILITGYSLSSYFSDLVDNIIQKSQCGIFVKFFVNDIDKQTDFEKLLRYKGRFLKIYDYRNEEDMMSALHAKVISVDQQKTLITSANLSYHGQQGNIELGTLIESKKVAKQIDDVFTKLLFSKVFMEV